ACGQLAQLVEHAVHAGGVQIASELQEEEVFPVPAGDGPGLNLQQVQVLHGEDGENLVEGTALVGQGEEGADLVALFSVLRHRRDHHKAGGVGVVVVDPLGQDVQ